MPLQLEWYGRALLGASLVVCTSCAAPSATDPEPSSGSEPPPPGVLVPARPADQFVQSIGLNLHLSYFQTVYGDGWATIVKPKLLSLGVRHVRDNGSVTSSDSWMRLVYGRMNELAAAKIKFTLILRPAEGSTDYTSAAHLDRLITYAGSAVESFEGLNEHDLSGHANWVTEVKAFQKAAYARLKADQRTSRMPVLGPAMAHAVNASQVGDLSGYMNYGALHPYPGGSRPLANLETHIRYGRTINGSRPLVVTESGYHTALRWNGSHPHIAEDAEARYVPRLYLDYFSAGFARTFLYELIDQGTSDTLREERFGLLRMNGAPKPAYVALQRLITVLADPGPAFAATGLGFTLSGDTTDVRQLLLQKRDGRFDLVLWHDAVSWDLSAMKTAPATAKPVSLVLDRAARRVRTWRVTDAEAPTGDWSGVDSLALVVPDSPLVVEITP